MPQHGLPLYLPMNKPLVEHLGILLSARLGRGTTIRDAIPLYGGSVNDAFRLATDAGPFFLKTNTADRFPSLFVSEERGLGILRRAGVLRVPEVIAQGELDGTTFLLMEHIAQAEEDRGFQHRFGRSLAQLHRHTRGTFGLDHDNFIGLLPQKNTAHADWADFMVLCRLDPLVQLARDNQRINPGDVLRFERLYRRLPELFPAEPPALLHGDLWKNNYLASTTGEPVLIDPAVYYGHREMDLAMTRLFGGFDREFHTAYQEEAPLAPGWEDRVDLCNLYPVLVHLNLFGGSYANRLGALLRRYA